MKTHIDRFIVNVSQNRSSRWFSHETWPDSDYLLLHGDQDRKGFANKGDLVHCVEMQTIDQEYHGLKYQVQVITVHSMFWV